MSLIRTTLALAASAAAVAVPLSLDLGQAQAAPVPAAAHAPAAAGTHTAPIPNGALVSARAALRGWTCDPVADEKFSCQDSTGAAAFTVVQRSISSLPKWQDDPEIADQVAVVRKSYFLTVQPVSLSPADFAAVKAAIAHTH